MRPALAVEGELTLNCPPAPHVRILAQGSRIVIAVDGLRQAFELRRSLDFALPREARARLAQGLRIADLSLEVRIRGRKVATLGAPGDSWLAASLGFPGTRLDWYGLVRTLLWPGRAGPALRGRRPS